MAINFVKRNDIYEKNAVLARYLFDWQASSFDPALNEFEEGEEVWLDMDADAPVALSLEQAVELNLENEENCRAMRDEFVAPPPAINRCGDCIAELEAESFERFVSLIGPAVCKLVAAMGWDEMLYITAYRDAYLCQDNDFPAAQQAADDLKNIGFLPDFAGGVILKRDENDQILGPLFSLQRYNASAPYVHFSAPGSAIVGTLCKYGNLHFDGYEGVEMMRLCELLPVCGFVVPEDGICEEKFSEDGAIEGRRLELD